MNKKINMKRPEKKKTKTCCNGVKYKGCLNDNEGTCNPDNFVYNQGRQDMIDYLPDIEELCEVIVQEMSNKILKGYTPMDLAKAISKRIGK